MSASLRGPVYFAIMGVLLMIVGFAQSWSLALAIVNLCLISSIMALGVNMQWGYAGLFNVGVMGFVALGGLGAVIVSMPIRLTKRLLTVVCTEALTLLWVRPTSTGSTTGTAFDRPDLAK